jgi:hypothetical protein
MAVILNPFSSIRAKVVSFFASEHTHKLYTRTLTN